MFSVMRLNKSVSDVTHSERGLQLPIPLFSYGHLIQWSDLHLHVLFHQNSSIEVHLSEGSCLIITIIIIILLFRHAFLPGSVGICIYSRLGL